jgi:hypothetical protein
LDSFQFLVGRPVASSWVLQSQGQGQGFSAMVDDAANLRMTGGDDREPHGENKPEKTWQEEEALQKEEGRFDDTRPIPNNDCEGGKTERPSLNDHLD